MTDSKEKYANKIIIDTDPGVDDALAIILAIESPDIELLGITTMFGNADIETTTSNALRIVELSGQSIPVAKGAGQPLVVPAPEPPDFVHGKDGLGNTFPLAPASKPIDLAAAAFIVETVRANPGQVTLLGVAGMTNFAAALALDPEIVTLVKEVVVMGGVLYRPGNVTPVSEANIAADPHAADAVFTAGWKVTMVGLDVTLTIFRDREWFASLRKRNAKYGAFLDEIHQFYIDFYKSRDATFDGCAIHDSAALLYIIDPTLFVSKSGPMRVVTDGIAIGQTIMAAYPFQWELAPWAGMPVVTVPVDVDREGLVSLMEGILFSDTN